MKINYEKQEIYLSGSEFYNLRRIVDNEGYLLVQINNDNNDNNYTYSIYGFKLIVIDEKIKGENIYYNNPSNMTSEIINKMEEIEKKIKQKKEEIQKVDTIIDTIAKNNFLKNKFLKLFKGEKNEKTK